MTKPTPEPNRPLRGLYISGEWVSGYGKNLVSKDPYNGLVVYEKPAANPSDVSRAVRAAVSSLRHWESRSFEERMEVLRKYASLLQERKGEMSKQISLETGKPKKEADLEVDAMVAKVEISIKAHLERCGEKVEEKEGFTAVTRFKPHGVIAVLGPFNFPGHLPNGHIVPLLLAGNSVVFKASEFAPSVGEFLVKLFEEAGLPKGTLNLLQGDGRVGKALAEHPDIDGLTFTGSSKTGLKLKEQFGKDEGKILALEMGGNNPLLFASANDLDKAVDIALISSFQSAGQRCTSARRLILVRSEQAKFFLEKLTERAKNVKLGAYDEDPFMGPLINEDAVVTALTKQAELEARGAKVLLKLEALRPGTGQVSCGIVDITGMDAPDEEIFAPLLKVQWAEDFTEAVELAAKTSYGLSAAILTTEKREYDYFSFGVKVGILNWNRPTTGALSTQPFGGVGKSGNFRPAGYFAADFCSYPVVSLESDS